jgi:DNA integrity scanning protein DisA with diadenylate cyclase activity
MNNARTKVNDIFGLGPEAKQAIQKAKKLIETQAYCHRVDDSVSLSDYVTRRDVLEVIDRETLLNSLEVKA